jgi:hypothetical protein
MPVVESSWWILAASGLLTAPVYELGWRIFPDRRDPETGHLIPAAMNGTEVGELLFGAIRGAALILALAL